MPKKTIKTKSKEPKKQKESTAKKPKTEDKKIKSKTSGKKYLLIIPIIIIICIIGFVLLTINLDLISPDTAKAQLIIESGTVQVKHTGESWTTAENGMDLYQSDSVKTGNNASATIVFFQSSIIRLDSNTEITLDQILEEVESSVKIKQDSGRTWNTVLKISGIDNYEVQTPTTVASVRGTSFDVNFQTNGGVVVGVGRGTTYVSSIFNGETLDTIEVNEDEAVLVDPGQIGQTLAIIPFEKDEWVLSNLQKDQDILTSGNSAYIGFSINVKDELYKRIGPFKSELERVYGVTDEELEVLIDGYLLGYFDLPPDTPDWIREIIELS